MFSTDNNSPALLSAGAVDIPFNEKTQQALYSKLLRKSAMAAGLEAMAMRSIETGETDQLDKIAHLAAHLAEELNNLALIAAQFKATVTA